MLLATFQLAPQGEWGGDLIVSELGARGIDARWERWDDERVDWASADLVAVRSTWDYHRRLAEFLSWSHRVAATTELLNGPTVFGWNAVKDYLIALGRSVPVVPTVLLDDATLLHRLTTAVEEWGTVVVKPATGAGGVGLVIVDSPLDERLEGLTAGPWVAQPLVESIRSRGEASLFVLAGRVAVQVDKVPSAGEVRVHEVYGGTSRVVPTDPDLADLALAAVTAAEHAAGARLDYARVDLLHHDGRWVVSELELIEPGLYLHVAPQVAAHFADVVAARVAAARA